VIYFLGLFHQAIAQSGTAYCPWALEKGSLDTAKRVAAAVGCPADSPKELIKCLKKSSSADLLRAQESSSIVVRDNYNDFSIKRSDTITLNFMYTSKSVVRAC